MLAPPTTQTSVAEIAATATEPSPPDGDQLVPLKFSIKGPVEVLLTAQNRGSLGRTNGRMLGKNGVGRIGLRTRRSALRGTPQRLPWLIAVR